MDLQLVILDLCLAVATHGLPQSRFGFSRNQIVRQPHKESRVLPVPLAPLHLPLNIRQP